MATQVSIWPRGKQPVCIAVMYGAIIGNCLKLMTVLMIVINMSVLADSYK